MALRFKNFPELSATLMGVTSTAEPGTDDAAGGGGSGAAGADEQLGDAGLRALQAERDRNKGLDRELSTLRTQMKALEGRIDPETFAQVKAEADEAQRKLAEQQQAVERVKAEAEATYGQQLRTVQEQLNAEKQARVEERRRVVLERVFQAAKGRNGADELGTSYFDLFYGQRASSYALADDGSPYVVDPTGQPVIDSETGKRVDPIAWTRTVAQRSPVLGILFEPEQGTGGGFNSSRGAALSDGQDLSKLSPSQLMTAAYQRGS